MIDAYRKGMFYEIFLKRAFKFDRRLKRPTPSEFENLIRSEEKNQSREMEEVKKRLRTACNLFIQNGNNPEKNALSELILEIDNAGCSEDIYACIQKGLKISERFK